MRVLLLLCLWLLAGWAQAQVTELRGQTASGAYFVAQAPNGWQAGGTLVLVHHGYDIEPLDQVPSLGPAPLRQRFLAKGYAIAASSYSQRGWALFRTARDHRELVAAFAARFGAPGRLISSGGSMGGLVAMQSAEQGDLGAPVAGVYALCAPLAGTRVWDQALDLRVVYDTVCDNVTGGELPNGDSRFPYILDADDLDDYDDLSGGGALVARINKCTGLNLPDVLQTSGMRERLSRLLTVTGTSRDFLLENMFYATYGLGDLYRDPAKIGERPALGTRFVQYGDPIIDRDVRRVTPDRFAALDLKRHFTPSGRVGQARVLSTHTSRDGLVVPEHGRALVGKIPASQWTQAYVNESRPSHCSYSDAELLGGFEALDRWIALGTQPTAATLQSECLRERAANPALGECRYDPNFQPGTLDAKLKPRLEASWPVQATSSGLWFDPTRSGEGFVLQPMGDGRALAAWFTYPAPGVDAEQLWVLAQGRWQDDALILDQAYRATGNGFGAALNPASVQLQDMGRLDVAYTACSEGEVRSQAPAPYGETRQNLRRLSRIGIARCPGDPPLLPTPDPNSGDSGAWFDPTRSGQGLFLSVQSDGRAFLLLFGFEPTGKPLWLFAEGRLVDQEWRFDDLARPIGARFGTAFRPQDVRFERFGSATLRRINCQEMDFRYDSPLPGYGQGLLKLRRLSQPLGAICS